MDAREARENLEMVDRILAQAEPVKHFRPYARLLVIIGVAAAVLECGIQLSMSGRGNAVVYAGIALMAAGYVYLIWTQAVLRRASARISNAEARQSRSIGAVWLAVFIAAFAQPHIFANWGASAIWNLGACIQMLMFGFSGDRRSLAGGIALGASIVGANYAINWAGYILAAGFLAGYVVPGILKLIDTREGC